METTHVRELQSGQQSQVRERTLAYRIRERVLNLERGFGRTAVQFININENEMRGRQGARKIEEHVLVPDMEKPLTLYCDNSGAVANSREPRSHKRGKHIERKYHLIREIVNR